ncbi:hypothetical protein [Cytobacillus gottheilii]|uniref:Phage protein n=1 Tax=Cytobacillus gottheilii TaxID=859144 RepID=A0ABX8F941_9BACI|nr:hypothetical protein [Cytobacillus gottheilii]QVY60933.1 hypothetical protein J1899_18470 [Cytobacillus gottheilii]
MVNKQPVSVKEAVFSKEQILKAANYRERRDLLSVLLKDDQQYSLAEVDQTIEKFMKKRVK